MRVVGSFQWAVGSVNILLKAKSKVSPTGGDLEGAN